MKTIKQLGKIPTLIENVHESVYRSYHILLLIMELIEMDTPHKVIKYIYDELMENIRQEQKAVVNS